MPETSDALAALLHESRRFSPPAGFAEQELPK